MGRGVTRSLDVWNSMTFSSSSSEFFQSPDSSNSFASSVIDFTSKRSEAETGNDVSMMLTLIKINAIRASIASDLTN